MEKDGDLITLAFDIVDTAEELQTDWEYLSEERDRFGVNFDFNNPQEGVQKEIVSRVDLFHKLYVRAMNTELMIHPHVAPFIQSGSEHAEKIQNGEFMSYRLPFVCYQ